MDKADLNGAVAPTTYVDIWRMRFEQAPAWSWAWSRLSDEEKARADAFRVVSARERFVQARAFLREVLCRSGGGPARDVGLAVGPHGKPHLVHPVGSLRFNLSHSATTCVVALCAGAEVGVDTEPRGPVADRDVMVPYVLTCAERHAFNAKPPEARDDFFLRCWTRKEAVTKALGVGLALEPSTCPTRPDAEDGALLVWPTPTGEARLRLFDLGEAYDIVALAIVDPGRPVLVRRQSYVA